jgi:hypothetical protein
LINSLLHFKPLRLISVYRGVRYDALQLHVNDVQHVRDDHEQRVHDAQLFRGYLLREQHERVCGVQQLSHDEQQLFRDDRVS